MKLSVVIPTYNRRDRLARVLAALSRQTLPLESFEVVVVDDGSSDGTSDYLASYKSPFELLSLRLSNGGPARARNAGVEAASGAVILFIDDDVEPSDSLLAEHLKAHQAEDNVVVIGPLGSLPHYDDPWVAWEQRKVEGQYEAMLRGDWAPTFRQFWTGNASVAKRHLIAAGLFDPSYLRAEDVELGLRLLKLGLGFRFRPEAKTLHHVERTLDSWEKVHASYGKAEVAIFSGLGEAEMLELLSGNWQRLNPASRWVILQCLNHPRRHRAARLLLRSHLNVARKLPLPLLSEKACSLLAGLLYWQASADTLGPERARVVFGSAG
ncbi:MAG TPA: glycosyltransferase family 2 protein [Polyangiaceae bacterium]|nr:glycosyltransferase family 2 protein [Polyangiaceae bacterium]